MTSAVLTRSGGFVDLVRPVRETIDVGSDIAVALSLIKRFGGHAGVPEKGYSVAQHCCLGADVLLHETGDQALAFHFLMHDAHEAYCGDIATPVVRALDAIANERSGGKTRRLVGDAVHIMKARLDGAIYESLGLAWPPPRETLDSLREMDRRMLRHERERLMPKAPRRLGTFVTEAPVIECLPPLVCWTAAEAAQSWLMRFATLWPAAVTAEAAP